SWWPPFIGLSICARDLQKSSPAEETGCCQAHCQCADNESARSGGLKRLEHFPAIEQHDHLERIYAWNHDGLCRERQDDRRVCPRGLSGRVQEFGCDDVHCQSRGRCLSKRSWTKYRKVGGANGVL